MAVNNVSVSDADSNNMHDAEKQIDIVHDEQVFETVTDALPPGYFKSMRFIGTMFAAQSAWAAGVGSFGLTAPLLGVINNDIGPSPQLVWVALAYTLPLAVGQTLVGRLSDLFGRRWFFICGTILSLIGCIVCATAQNIPSLIGGTVLVGLAASAQLAVTYVLAELVPMKHRFLANSFIYVGVTPFVGLGPAISYAFVLKTSAGWRGCYYLIIAINAFSLLCWVLFYHPPTFRMKHKSASRMDLIRKFDFVGLILFTGGLLIFLMGLSWGGSVHPWKSSWVIATIVVGGISVIAFVLWEAFAKLEAPVVPTYLFRNRGWVAIIFLCSISATVYYAFSIVWPQMVFGLYTSDEYYGGWLSCLIGAGTNIGQLASGIFGRIIGKQKWQLVTCMVLGGAVLGACACATPDNKNTVAALVTIGSFFTGYLDSIGLAMASICVKDQADIGTAVGITGSIRGAVSTIGVAIYSVILSNKLAENIPAMVVPAVEQAGLPASSVAQFLGALSGTGNITAVPGVSQNIIAVGTAAYKLASVKAYRMVFFSTIAFSGVAVILALCTPNVDELMTDKVATTLHGRGEEDIDSKQ